MEGASRVTDPLMQNTCEKELWNPLPTKIDGSIRKHNKTHGLRSAHALPGMPARSRLLQQRRQWNTRRQSCPLLQPQLAPRADLHHKGLHSSIRSAWETLKYLKIRKKIQTTPQDHFEVISLNHYTYKTPNRPQHNTVKNSNSSLGRAAPFWAAQQHRVRGLEPLRFTLSSPTSPVLLVVVHIPGLHFQRGNMGKTAMQSRSVLTHSCSMVWGAKVPQAWGLVCTKM